jgi:hypothetical protein
MGYLDFQPSEFDTCTNADTPVWIFILGVAQFDASLVNYLSAESSFAAVGGFTCAFR